MTALCEMTVTGFECGAPAWGGVGIVHPVTDRYISVLLSCQRCATAAVDIPKARFRVLDLELAHRLRAQ